MLLKQLKKHNSFTFTPFIASNYGQEIKQPIFFSLSFLFSHFSVFSFWVQSLISEQEINHGKTRYLSNQQLNLLNPVQSVLHGQLAQFL